MRKPKNQVVVKTNRGHTIVMTAQYAKETPEEFWEYVYRRLEYIGVFDNLKF